MWRTVFAFIRSCCQGGGIVAGGVELDEAFAVDLKELRKFKAACERRSLSMTSRGHDIGMG